MREINFVETDPQKINAELINTFETSLGETLYPGDERRIFLEQETQVLVGLKNNINETGKLNLLRNARGEVLDALGERVNTERLRAKTSSVQCRIVLSSAQTSNIVIEKGKRITPDGVLFFALKDTLVIPAGQMSIDTIYEATEAGEKYNGFLAGQIKTIVDPIPYLATIVNISTSSGGAEIEADDDGVNVWSGYRDRIRQAPASFSTAGPEDAYIYWAKTADANIQDIAVISPEAGQIKITVLMENGELPTQTILDKVLSVCSDKKVRPLTDYVTVSAPTLVNYDIKLDYYIAKEQSANELAIKNLIENTGGIKDQFILWQKSKLGRDINPDYLRQMILNAGAARIELTSPAFTELTEEKVGVVSNVTLTYKGVI